MSFSNVNTGTNRVAGKGRLSPSKTVTFKFDGKQLNALEGDTLASALIANGIHLAGRSFKYHRPRGVLTAGSEEPNALITTGRGAAQDPNVRATVQEIYEGLEARSQNAWPSLNFDVMAVNDLAAPFLGAGFYYKTFMGLPPFEWGRGTGIWMQYEKLIRKAASVVSILTQIMCLSSLRKVSCSMIPTVFLRGLGNCGGTSSCARLAILKRKDVATYCSRRWLFRYPRTS